MSQILLLSMPYGALDRPALGISILKSALATKEATSHISCSVAYLTFTFAEIIGYEDYRWISSEIPYTAFAGDWVFTRSLYGARPAEEARYLNEVCRQTWQMSEQDIQRLLHIRESVQPFLYYCLNAIPWQDYSLIGFTSTFEQNIASLALAQQLKFAFPHLKIIFGGANWEEGMGVEYHKQFSFVDYACSGEADESFPALVQAIDLGKEDSETLNAIPGLIFRNATGETCFSGRAKMIQDMGKVAVPDFADYFSQIQRSPIGHFVMPTLLMETSRGCWWGAKSHCTFCGLNGGTMAFRSKDAQRAVDEISFLVNRWNVHQMMVVDNILDMSYFNTMLPRLAEADLPVTLFYEVKANLSRKQLKLLADAKVYRIQPGIESMSDHVLSLMRKGTTGLRNIQLLKWCKEFEINVDWNVLYGFPGETVEDYTSMIGVLDQIRFLNPPVACGPVRMDRFSPYFNTPTEFGLTNIRPMAPYFYLYPFSQEDLSHIAYYFEYAYQDGTKPIDYVAPVLAYIEEWKQNPEPGTLQMLTENANSLVLLDSRSSAIISELRLTGVDKAIYEYCDEMRTIKSILKKCRQNSPDTEITLEQITNYVDSLVANRFMISDGQYYLSLAVHIDSINPRIPYWTDTRPKQPRQAQLEIEIVS